MIIIGIDMAFAHVGLAAFEVHFSDSGIVLQCLDLKLVTTEQETAKSVRKSSSDLRRASEIVTAIRSFVGCAAVACAEVPSGSQSATAARALGIAVGVLASCPIPVIEVSQQEVKMASIGVKTASKEQIINWAVQRWPGAPWRTRKSKGQLVYLKDNEHLADACAAVAAGVVTNEFRRMIAATQHAIPHTTNVRPALGGAGGGLPLGIVRQARRRVLGT